MIEEKLTIDFKEYLSYFYGSGKSRDAEKTQCYMEEINKTVNKFLAGATAVAHHGFSIHGKHFHVRVDVLISADDDSVSLDIRDSDGVSAKYSFDATMELVMTKTNNCVVIG